MFVDSVDFVKLSFLAVRYPLATGVCRCQASCVIPEPDQCYRAVTSRDARFDGWFFTAVTSTGIYCRPSCPARTPKRSNVAFFTTAAAAQLAGFRACKRCRPEATPGSPEWNSRADLVARAMRLIADGIVDREGVTGLARRLSYSERHLNRLLLAEVGAGPLALARAQRAHTARVLIETTDLSFAHVAFASGFASIRQFNDTIGAVFASTPTNLRRRTKRRADQSGGVALRLSFRRPLHVEALLGFLGPRAIPGVEEYAAGVYRRTLRLPHGGGVVALRDGGGSIACQLHLDDWRDLGPAVQRCRRLLDLDADPTAVDHVLGGDPVLAPLVAARPGLRIPGAVEGFEVAVRAIVGQQISVAGARTLTAELVRRLGKPLTAADRTLTHQFPEPGALVDADPASFGLPASRGRALVGLARSVDVGALELDPGADQDATTRGLLDQPGIGRWTAGYVAMRALGDPDVLLETDVGTVRACGHLGLPRAPGPLTEHAERWRPWRSYGLQHLWASLAPAPRRKETDA
jgi:AraC family transcriptional regulator of adaptative response / DNA-3-methyladenine glycosylase II